MFSVTLTPDEINLAASHGLYRRIKKHEGKREDRPQKERSIWDNEIEGSCAELAWCKHWGQYWSGLSGIRESDGVGVEVKWTRHANGGVILNRKLSDDTVYVLAKGFAPTFFFVGWITGGEGKLYAEDSGFGLLVPAKFLHPWTFEDEPSQLELLSNG